MNQTSQGWCVKTNDNNKHLNRMILSKTNLVFFLFLPLLHDRLMARRWRRWWALRRSEWWPSCCRSLQRDFRKPSPTKSQSVSKSFESLSFLNWVVVCSVVSHSQCICSWVWPLVDGQVQWLGITPASLSHTCTDIKGAASPLGVVHPHEEQRTHTLIPYKEANCCHWHFYK